MWFHLLLELVDYNHSPEVLLHEFISSQRRYIVAKHLQGFITDQVCCGCESMCVCAVGVKKSFRFTCIERPLHRYSFQKERDLNGQYTWRSVWLHSIPFHSIPVSVPCFTNTTRSTVKLYH